MLEFHPQAFSPLCVQPQETSFSIYIFPCVKAGEIHLPCFEIKGIPTLKKNEVN